VIRPSSLKLGLAKMEDAAEYRRDPPAGPPDRILDHRKGTRLIWRLRERVQELAHQIAAAVIEARHLVVFEHRVVGVVLERSSTVGHAAKITLICLRDRPARQDIDAGSAAFDDARPHRIEVTRRRRAREASAGLRSRRSELFARSRS